jgi:hypothetical protein
VDSSNRYRHGKSDYGETEIGLSVVAIVELIHGVQRAGTDKRRQRHQALRGRTDQAVSRGPNYPYPAEPPVATATAHAVF